MKKKLYFKNTKGNKLCGILSDPLASETAHHHEAKNLITVLCHGFGTSKDGRTFVSLEEILNKRGVPVFRFDFFAHGESDGKFEDITISEAIDDVLHAVDYVRGLGYGEIGLVGSSFGGMASIAAASQIKDLSFLVLKSPVSDYLSRLLERWDHYDITNWKEKGFITIEDPEGETQRLKYSFYEEAKKISGHDVAGNIKVPTLVVHGSEDESVPVAQSRKLADLIPNCRLEVFEGADHRYSKPEDFARMLDVISKFILSLRGKN